MTHETENKFSILTSSFSEIIIFTFDCFFFSIFYFLFTYDRTGWESDQFYDAPKNQETPEFDVIEVHLTASFLFSIFYLLMIE